MRPDGLIWFVMSILLILIITAPGCTGGSLAKPPAKEDRPESLTDDLDETNKEAHKEPIDKPVLRGMTKANYEKSRDVVDPQVDKLLAAQHRDAASIKDLIGQLAARDKKIARLEAKAVTGPLLLYGIGGLAILVGIIVVAFLKDVPTGGVIGLGGVAICGLAWVLTTLSGYAWVLWVAIPVGVGLAALFLLLTTKGKKIVNDMRTTVDTLVSSIGGLTELEQAIVLKEIRAVSKTDAAVVRAEVAAAKRRTKTK